MSIREKSPWTCSTFSPSFAFNFDSFFLSCSASLLALAAFLLVSIRWGLPSKFRGSWRFQKSRPAELNNDLSLFKPAPSFCVFLLFCDVSTKNFSACVPRMARKAAACAWFSWSIYQYISVTLYINCIEELINCLPSFCFCLDFLFLSIFASLLALAAFLLVSIRSRFSCTVIWHKGAHQRELK